MKKPDKSFDGIPQPKKKIHFAITFSEEGFARLKVLMNLDESKDMSEFLRRALGWYGITIECIATGGTITLEQSEESGEMIRNYQDVIEWLNRKGIK